MIAGLASGLSSFRVDLIGVLKDFPWRSGKLVAGLGSGLLSFLVDLMGVLNDFPRRSKRDFSTSMLILKQKTH